MRRLQLVDQLRVGMRKDSLDLVARAFRCLLRFVRPHALRTHVSFERAHAIGQPELMHKHAFRAAFLPSGRNLPWRPAGRKFELWRTLFRVHEEFGRSIGIANQIARVARHLNHG